MTTVGICTDCGRSTDITAKPYLLSLCADCFNKFHARCVPCDVKGLPLAVVRGADLAGSNSQPHPTP
jgi:hypothetical protein